MAITEEPRTNDRLIWTFNMLMDIKATAEETGGALSIMDSWLTPAANPPLHVHHSEDESFYVVEGEVEYFLGDAAPRVARAGDFVFGPRGVPHRFEVRTPEAHVLVIGTPGGADAFFRDMGEPAAAPTLPVPHAPDIERVLAAGAKHDVEILGPPPA